MQFNWANITSLAYLTLLEQDIREFPIPVKKIKCKGVKICSYQKYAEITGATLEQITLRHELDDAFLLRGLRPGITLILYNKGKYPPRMKHTLWHEIGHIKCEHKKHSEKEEIEAHFFAAQITAPNVLIKALYKRGYSISTQFLMECFGISKEAAEKKMEYLRKYTFNHSNEYDDSLLEQFSQYLSKKYPPKNSCYYDEYFDEMEKERQNWY